VRATLAQTSKQAATAALVEGRRDAAVERTLRARELGMPESELGFGTTLLAEEAQRALEQGVEAFEAGDAARAEERFERALRLDPRSLAARNHLGVVLFRRGAYAAAAGHWRTLLDAARAEGLELPDPVHLNLARALYLDGRPDEVRALLSAELERDPDGPWADAARELLERLNAEAAGPGGDDR
jgi:Flp pilus assembly protein TadD